MKKVINLNKKGEIIDLSKITLSKELSKRISEIARGAMEDKTIRIKES